MSYKGIAPSATRVSFFTHAHFPAPSLYALLAPDAEPALIPKVDGKPLAPHAQRAVEATEFPHVAVSSRARAGKRGTPSGIQCACDVHRDHQSRDGRECAQEPAKPN